MAHGTASDLADVVCNCKCSSSGTDKWKAYVIIWMHWEEIRKRIKKSASRLEIKWPLWGKGFSEKKVMVMA